MLKNVKYQLKKCDIKQFNRYLRKQELEVNLENKKGHWLILTGFLTEETMLLNL